MGWVLELVEKAMTSLVAEPARLLDPNFDMYKEVADEVPEFCEW